MSILNLIKLGKVAKECCEREVCCCKCRKLVMTVVPPKDGGDIRMTWACKLSLDSISVPMVSLHGQCEVFEESEGAS